MLKVQQIRALRQLHYYVGVFLAPAIILFALSGALQTFRLQEEKGFGGPPPGWIVWMASVHKDQAQPRAAPAGVKKPSGEAKPSQAAQKPGAERPSTLPLKIFVILLAIGLIASALLGVVIALNNRATRRVSAILLAAGAVVPLLLLA
jgi:hypothetical protein